MKPESTAAPPKLRVGLRPLAEGDEVDLEGWLPQAVALSTGRKKPAEEDERKAKAWLRNADGSALTILQDEKVLGIIVCCPGGGCVSIDFIAIEQGERQRGLGGEAVFAFEEIARHKNWGQKFKAFVHADNGLGVYFWLRVGYRPARADDLVDLTSGEPGTWMVRCDPS